MQCELLLPVFAQVIHYTPAQIRLHSRNISLGNKAKRDLLIAMQQPTSQIWRKYLLSTSTVSLQPRLLLQHEIKVLSVTDQDHTFSEKQSRFQ